MPDSVFYHGIISWFYKFPWNLSSCKLRDFLYICGLSSNCWCKNTCELRKLWEEEQNCTEHFLYLISYILQCFFYSINPNVSFLQGIEWQTWKWMKISTPVWELVFSRTLHLISDFQLMSSKVCINSIKRQFKFYDNNCLKIFWKMYI